MVQLPAVNTPQFVVMRNRMGRRSQPVRPIFSPTVAAESILYAAEHPSRELFVAGSTLKAVLGQKLAPGLIDRYLAKTGYQSQLTPEREEPGRPDNLFDSLPGDRGADGPFTRQARTSSVQFWIREHPRLLGMSGAALSAAAVLLLGRRIAR
jgi:hypothetical protein